MHIKIFTQTAEVTAMIFSESILQTFNTQIQDPPAYYPTPTVVEHTPILMAHQVDNVITMNRVTVIGSSGSGKSTLARELGKKMGLPVIHLDKFYWHPGWVGTPFSEWQATVQQLITADKWIIDGNYRSTLDIRLQASDTVVFLDLPRWLCVYRAMKRRIQYRNKPRPDIARGCKERLFDPNFPRFIRWIWDYPNRARPDVLRRLNRLEGKQVIWLRSTKDVNSFLADPTGWQATTPSFDEEFLEFLERSRQIKGSQSTQ